MNYDNPLWKRDVPGYVKKNFAMLYFTALIKGRCRWKHGETKISAAEIRKHQNHPRFTKLSERRA